MEVGSLILKKYCAEDANEDYGCGKQTALSASWRSKQSFQGSHLHFSQN